MAVPLPGNYNFRSKKKRIQALIPSFNFPTCSNLSFSFQVTNFVTFLYTVREAGLMGQTSVSCVTVFCSWNDHMFVLCSPPAVPLPPPLMLLFEEKTCNQSNSCVPFWGTFSHCAASFSPPVFSLSVGKQNRGLKEKTYLATMTVSEKESKSD